MNKWINLWPAYLMRSERRVCFEKKKILTCDLWIIICILHQQDRVPIMIQPRKSCLRHIFWHKFLTQVLTVVHSFDIFFWLAAHFFSLKILSVGRLISVYCLVYKFISTENEINQILIDHTVTICTKNEESVK